MTMKNTQGATGAVGATGPTGATGATGATGPTGNVSFPIFSDGFTAYDAAQYTGDTASFQATSGELAPASGSGWKYLLRPGLSLSSGRIDLKHTQGDGALYLMLKWIDANNYLVFRQDATNYQWTNRVAGVDSAINATVSAVAAGQVRWYRVFCNGSDMVALRYASDPNASGTPPTPQIVSSQTVPDVWKGRDGLMGIGVFFSDLTTRIDDLKIGLA